MLLSLAKLLRFVRALNSRTNAPSIVARLSSPFRLVKAGLKLMIA